jgi:hypothetical protein
MKKLLLIAAAFLVAAPIFAQTEKKITEKKPVASETKTVVKKAPVKKDAKVAISKDLKEAVPAEKKLVETAPQIVDSKESLGEPVQVAPVAAPAPPVDVNKLFEFKNDAFDFGKIPAGKAAKYDLFIKNISKETAELTLVQPGCGCTTPEYEAKKKFAPGETVKVTLGFNGGAPGSGTPFSKSVTVTLNSNVTKVVTFKGETYAVPTESAPANGSIDKLKPAEETKH